MAVGGIQNVSVYDSAFLRESRSPGSRLWGEPERTSPRPSSVLQMWRELEGEHVVSHQIMRPLGSESSCSDHLENVIHDENEVVSCSVSLVDSDNEREEIDSFCSGESTGLGETGRDRVRQVFREWMGSGAKNHSTNDSHRNNGSRSPWLGRNECERVRVIREWVQINTQPRGGHVSPRDELLELGSQIEQVRDGQMVSHREVGERRPLRKLCGRQAVLDMLVRSQRERKEEIHKLLQKRPVSDFAHRNRIQTLLKGRFLLNQRVVRDERPACTAVNELGLLRQRHAVSNLRDGFLSRFDRGSLNDVQCDSSSNNDLVDLRNGQPRSRNELDDEGEIDRNVHVNSQTEDVEIQNPQNNAVRDVDRQEHSVLETEVEVRALINNTREDETGGSWSHENSPEECSEQVSDIVETVTTHLLDAHPLNDGSTLQNVDANELVSAPSETVCTSQQINNASNPQNVDASDEELQESVSESELEENDLQQFSDGENRQWTQVNIEDDRLQETGSQWYDDSAIDVVMEQTQMQESDEEWPRNVLQEAIDSWLDVPSGQETAGTTERAGSFYFPDEENIQSTELRQLLSRRRVSTLLRSGFRESLDQLIQSYVQRQNEASAEWDLDEASSSHPSLEQEQEEPENHHQVSVQEARWSLELQDDDWPDLNPHRRTQNEWEIINELRIDMAMLQQRMYNMQNMMESCMDLQLELQRSLRQEVSAALNRPFDNSTGNIEITNDDSKWDHVRKGICCICCDSHIDTLLYRCGHMCTCSKCGEELVQGGKCPMCYAPVREVVRAYFIQE